MAFGRATIVSHSENGVRACAAAARLSTSGGDSISAFSQGDGGERDKKLIRKVLSSGHQTIIEHQHMTIAFDGVSVLMEQLLIEFRLASYTVKSRRYVDFSGAGYVTPELPSKECEKLYTDSMTARFDAYEKLLALNIPREDARFVLPYCFKSNFYMSVNARELSHMLNALRFGRLSRYPEAKALGDSLAVEIAEIFPNIADIKRKKEPDYAETESNPAINAPEIAKPSVELISGTDNAEQALDTALTFTNRFMGDKDPYRALTKDPRPRELEMLNYVFRINDVSLACLTHFSRHRIQSQIAPAPETALLNGKYVLPKTISQNPEAEAIYKKQFADNVEAAREALKMGMPACDIAYFALAGNTVDILTGMNARELLHFLKLRTCTRAQWEIRESAQEMLVLLTESCPKLFRNYGASCLVDGACPEGRLSCGRLRKTEE